MIDREHQWVLIATYEYTTADIERRMAAQEPAMLRYEYLLDIAGPACFRCEGFWDEVHGEPCQGGERMPKNDALKLTRLGQMEEIEREH